MTPETAGATPPTVQRSVAYRTVDSLTIDGALEEVSWRESAWSGPFVDIEGDRRPMPPWQTRVKLVWDDSALYIGAELEEPHLWATITERDAVIFHDNDFEVFLDPDGDTHRYYELEINALGTVWDLFLDKPYRDGGTAVDEWDIEGLQTAVALEGTLNDPADLDGGWSVEIRIPWVALPDRLSGHGGGPPHDGEVWRINFSRVQWHLDVADSGYRKRVNPGTGVELPEENWVWSSQDAINMHMPEMWGVVQFSGLPAGTGTAHVRPIEGEADRWLLRRVYYAERVYRQEHGRFGSLEEVGITARGLALMVAGSSARYRASVTRADGIWWIDQDGRLSHERRGEE